MFCKMASVTVLKAWFHGSSEAHLGYPHACKSLTVPEAWGCLGAWESNLNPQGLAKLATNLKHSLKPQVSPVASCQAGLSTRQPNQKRRAHNPPKKQVPGHSFQPPVLWAAPRSPATGLTFRGLNGNYHQAPKSQKAKKPKSQKAKEPDGWLRHPAPRPREPPASR